MMDMDDQSTMSDENYHSVLCNISDPMHLISKEVMLNAIKPGDAAIDLIGIVKSIEMPNSIEKNGVTLQVLNFTIECENNVRINLTMWNEEIARLKPFVVLNNLIHIDSPFARPQKSSSWTNYKNYILTCRSNTAINTLKSYKAIKAENVKSDCKEFDDIQKCIDYVTGDKKDEMISLNVFVRTEFRKDGHKNVRYIGVVTDCKQKLITYIYDFDESKILKKGQKIKLMGKIIDDFINKIVFEVMSISDITIDEKVKISEEDLEKFIIKMPKRKSNDNQLKDCDSVKTMKID